MLDQRCAAAQTETTREQLFAERYETLLTWALYLTHQQRESAEDLVQDAFVQFTLARTQLEEIENINGYLRRLLRNMYISKMTRLSQRLHDTALSIADYDTLRLGWTTIEPPRRMQAAEQLHQICTYACFRKQSSRAGSVLILRFFLDYLPTEIAGVISSSRHCVDQWQRLARREVKVFLDEPSRLRFVDAKATAARAWTKYPASDCDLMLSLRGMIFASRQGPCLSKDELTAAYAVEKAESLSTTALAHVVSCPSCLDAVNALLGLPLLAERYAEKDCDRDEPPRGATGGGSGTPFAPLPSKLKRRVREIREHKPSELRIVVNGALLSSLRVGSELSELDLSLLADEPVEFIEVLSDQDRQLLFLSTNYAAQEIEHWAQVDLSDGRTLEVRLQLEDGPRLHVIYNDPGAEQVAIEEGLSSPLTIAPQRRRRRLRELLQNPFKRRVNAEESGSSSRSSTSLGLLGQSVDVHRTRLWSSPVWLTILFTIAIGGAFLLYKTKLETTPTAANLLAEALVAESDHTRTPDRVGHRAINLEIRRSSEGAVVSRQTIESWENHPGRKRIQRLYDENGRLIAAASQGADGTRTVYSHHATVTQSPGVSSENILLDLDDVWQLTPSVQEFDSLIAEPAAAALEQRTTSYVVTFEKERAIGASRLVKAVLTLSKADLHPIEQTLVVQRGEEWREYKFVEKTYELVPAKDLAPNVFEVEPELLGKATTVNAGEMALRTTSAGLSSPRSTTAVASTELEVDVAYLLNLAKGGRNEQVALTRSASGSLRVEGVVDSAERREEFLRVLRPVSTNPAVSVQIRTVAEAEQRPSTKSSQSFREVEDTASTIALAAELREYFARHAATSGQLDETIRAYSSRVVSRGYRALFHAVELKRLVERFARVDMRTLTLDARAKWMQMIREHALAFEDETIALRRELQPVFFSETPLNQPELSAISSDADLARAVEGLYRLALANNEALRQAFTISVQSSAAAFKSPQFRRSLEGATRLSKQISRYSQ
jgi:RNA polymerase sigma factor (sigma-70 family)